MPNTNIDEKWDLNKAIGFIRNRDSISDARKAETFFNKKISETEFQEKKAEYSYYLLRSKLLKKPIFEPVVCKKLYNTMIKHFKNVEKRTIREYKQNKNNITQMQLEAFYLTIEHYLGSLNQVYKEHNFVDALNRCYTDEMDFRKDKFRLQDHYIKYISYSIFGLTSKYGNSMGRWLLTSLFATFAFAGFFFLIDFIPETKPMVDLANGGTVFDYIYYSIVTFTTLGYGDIGPVSVLGKALATVEVTVGYLMLGMLVNLLGKKI